ncbi:NUDIX domain-containing protein [Actinacidiphila yeochonensis]|uniref:NUDIX domain-containing protein n=1 Tax=Actinacidiphila yeochonensis TaxID=89050 RepID=UPI000562EDB5|nr:NUDIX domain-containing protein [Actinacidiphila yeochonensis]
MTTPSPDFLNRLVADARADGITGFVAGAVITDADRVLLVRRKPDDYLGGLWEIPSGKVEAGESILGALHRETTEETGLTIDTVTGYIGHFDYTSSRGGATRQFNFGGTVKDTEPIVLTEHDAYQWAHRANLPPVSAAVLELITR